MDEEEYVRMLDHLQKYVPHLEKLISQLKDPKKKNKELQLSKLEGLLSMITDRKKKLKLDTLKKCEDVILKILQKVHPSIYKQMEQNDRGAPYTKFLCKTPPGEHNLLSESEEMKTARFQAARARLSEISTPASPSPPRDITIMTEPIVIPTEKVTRKPNPDEFQIKSWEKTFEKRSITPNTEVYRTEKPDIYSKAAESLTANFNKKPVFERLGTRVDMSVPPLSAEDLQKLTESDNISVSQLEHVRDDLKKKLIQEEGKVHMTDLRHKLNRDRQREQDKTHKSKPKVEKIIKDPDSKFGNLLSSIDDQILEKQDKKEDKQRSRSDKEKEKDKHKHKSKKRDKSKERHHSKDYKSKHHDKEKDSDKKRDHDKDNYRKERENVTIKEREEEKIPEKSKEETVEKPVFKRLADKYNPRPRKNSIDVMERFVPNENKDTKETAVPLNKDSLLLSKDSLLLNKDPILSNINPSLLSNVKEALANVKEPSLTKVMDKYPVSVKHNEPYLSCNKDNEQYLTNVKDTFYRPPPVSDVWTSPNYNVAPPQTLDFVPPPNAMGQMRTGNTYMNTFIVQNNMGNQYPPPNTFHNQMPPAKVFHPYDPINTSSAYELNKMSPVEFYPQNQRSTYSNRQYQQAYTARDRPPFPDSRDPRSAARTFNRDPRIRSREEKEAAQKTSFVPPPPPIIKRRSIEEAPTTFSQSKYDMMYSQTDRGKSKEETFISPLDSLYSVGGDNSQRVGKGYGTQKFRIPKKKQEIDETKTEEPPQLTKAVDVLEKIAEKPAIEQKTKTVDIIEGKIENQVEKTELPEEKTEKEEKGDKEQTEASQSDQSIIASFLANLIKGSDKKHLFNVLVHSLTGNVSDQQTKKFKRIQKIIDSDSEPENEETKPETTDTQVEEKEKTPEVEEVTPVETKLVTKTKTKAPTVVSAKKKKGKVVKKLVLRKSSRTKFKTKKVAESTGSTIDENSSQVVETVGERIKNRKRNVATSDTPKYRKCTELDRLHNDIKEMFICDGVLTATGKRMCRILKSDTEPNEETKSKGEEPTSLDSPKRRARTSNPKVLIEKTDFSKLVQRKTESDSDSESDAPIITRRLSRRKPLDVDSTSDSSPTKTPVTRSPSKRTQKNKPVYTESIESDDLPPPSEEKEEEETDATVEKEVPEKRVQKKKKRGHSWAIGVITKKSTKKKLASNTDELEVDVGADEPLPSPTPAPLSPTPTLSPAPASPPPAVPETKPEAELIKHDIDYFVEPQEKSDCKLCQFKGRFIVQHYKTVHPQSEVMISRVSPDNAKLAIEESIENSFSEMEAVNMFENKNRKKKFTYQCRFCQVVYKNETSENFFDHLTSHTGEYRFHCTSCQFKTANAKALRSHVYSSHQTNYDHIGSKTPVYPAPPNFAYVFGYICGTCNFIQLDKTCLDSHVKTYHNEDSIIYKINMSTVSSKPVFDKEDSVDTELEKSDNVDDKPIPTEECESSETQKPEESEVEEVAKEVFKTTPNGTLESTETDEKKHETMLMINQYVTPKKKSLNNNLLNKIQSSLDDNSKSEGQVPPAIYEASIPVKSLPEIIKPNDTEASVDIIKPPRITEHKVHVEKVITNKTKKPFPHIIERLQVHIDAQPPPLIPIDSFSVPPQLTPEEVLVQVGPIAARKKNNMILYMCYMQSCMFSSTSESEFQAHCTTFHNNKQWDGICNICNIDTNLTEVEDAFTHLSNTHINELEAEGKKPDLEVKSYLRMRRLSGDKLSEQKLELPIVTMSEETPFKIVNVETQPDETEEDNFNFPFQISSVTTLTPEEDQALNASPPPLSIVNSPISTLTVINSLANSGSVTNVSSASPIPVRLVFPVMSPIVANSSNNPQAPILVPISKSNISVPITNFNSTKPSSSKKIVLKDVPLQAHELIAPRKTATATYSLLSEQKLIHLYKCPESSCNFSTDVKRLFEVHLQQHPEFKPNVHIHCLYCNFKTECRSFVVHCDVRHGRCQYCCVYCFYRAINQSYVEMHQEREHPRHKKRVLKAPINSDALTSQAHITLPTLKSLVHFYECGVPGCDSKFIFQPDFINHSLSAHHACALLCARCPNITVNAIEAARHAQTHHVYMYHCRYCLFGGNAIEDIYHHLSLQHFALAPRIIERRFVPDTTNKSSSDYHWDDPKIFDRLTILSAEHPKYVTPAALIEVVPSYGPTKKSTTVPKNKITNIMKASLQDKNETITLYKAPPVAFKKQPVSIHIVEAPKNNEKSKDEDVVKKAIPVPVRTESPIVLNNFLRSPTDLLNLTFNISKQAEEEKKSSQVSTSVSSNVPDIVLMQSEPINVDDSCDTPNDVTIDKAPEVVNSEKTEEEVPLLVTEPTNSSTEPVVPDSKLDLSSNASFTEDELLEYSSDQMYDSSSSNTNCVRKKGLTGKDLFRCSICRAPFTTSNAYKLHVTKCVEINKSGAARPYACVHCNKVFKTVNSLIDHIRIHGTDRFACSLCDFKQSHQFHVRTHMKTRHNVNNTIIAPVNALKNNIDEDNFVLKPKINRQKSSEGTVNIDTPSAVSEVVLEFGPEDVASLPMRPIFYKEVKCTICGYATKVRANLIRHFQFHKTGKEVPMSVIAPVNPVPCLDKNEKMFDKMFNLSISSYNDAIKNSVKTDKKDQPMLTKDEEAELPSFVPVTKRYVCGASNCDYLCLEEAMLRSHLQALHSDETFYKCTHCAEVLLNGKGVINIDQILKHLRLHDLHLYKCRHCKFLNNLKSKVERHVSDKHPNSSPLVVIVREMEQEPEEAPHPQEEIKEAKPWRCGMCKYRCSTKPEIVAHVNNKHDLDTQFKCALCRYRTSTKHNFPSHFQSEHPGQNVDVIDAYYEEETNTAVRQSLDGGLFDTTPLWQREKNKIKHIRGIPIEDSNKSPKKTPAKLEEKVTEVKKNISSASKKPKTLKEKKMELTKYEENEIIEIEDDDNLLTIEDKPKRVEVGGKSRVISAFASQSDDDKKEGSEYTIEELLDMDITTLKNAELSGMGGPFGVPHNRQFLCPICRTFKTKKTQDFTHHLYKHLDYHRFVCTSCGLTGITYGFLQRHSARKHLGLPEAIHPMTPDPQIEDWVRKVLAVQRRIMLENENVATVSSTTVHETDKFSQKAQQGKASKTVTEINVADSSSSLGKPKVAHQCQHCPYSCRSASDLRKHERRHWVQKPLKCGYCDCEGVTNYEIHQHSKRAHPNLEPLVVTIPTPSTPTIKPIARKRKYPKNEGAISSSSDNTPTKMRLIDFDDSSQGDESTTSESKKGTINYKCGYCTVIGPLNVIKAHFKTYHTKLGFSVYRYTCKYCDKYFKNIDKARMHYREAHSDKVETCFDIADPPHKNQFKCEYCSIEFIEMSHFVNHHKALHSHLPLNLPDDTLREEQVNKSISEERKGFKCPYGQCNHFSNVHSTMRDHVRTHAKPYQCGHCSLRFIYPSAVRAHIRKDHPGLGEDVLNSHEGKLLYEELKANILSLNPNGEYTKNRTKKARSFTAGTPSPNKKPKLDGHSRPTARKSTTQIYIPKVKATARKSTTFIPRPASPSPPTPPPPPEPSTADDHGYTFYGDKPDLEGVENLKAILLFNGSYLRITFDQLEKIFDIYPTVEVIDLKHNRNEL